MDFKLSDDFVDTYRTKTVPWGYEDGAGNALGEITYLRTYSRKDPATGVKETWADTCRRVIEGMFTIQKRHCRQNHIEWKNDKAQRTAKDAYDRLFNMKWLPSGRGLWAMGSPLVMEGNNSAPLQSCAFASTEGSIAEAMEFLFDASMLGVGVGFDGAGAGKFASSPPEGEDTFVIPDSREGWVESLKLLLEAYIVPFKSGLAITPSKSPLPIFDYSEIRPAGAPIKRFGGVASGPEPLKKMHNKIKGILDNRVGQPITMTDIVDIGNIIGTCVVAGNVRRSAEIFFVDYESENLDEFLDLKNYEKNPDRAGHGWMCLPRDSWIMTSEGPKQVEDLIGAPFNSVLGGKTYRTESDGFFLTSQERKVYTLTTKQGYSIRATENHPIKTKNGFVNLEDLSEGDRILIADHEFLPWSGKGTYSEGYLVGAVWGDGTYTRTDLKKDTYRAVIELYGPHVNASYIDAVEEHARTINPKAKFNAPTKRGDLRLHNSALTELAREYGFAESKTVNLTIEKTSSDFYRGFLRAVFDSDGTVASYRKGIVGGQVILSQSSYADLQAIQRMLGRLGIYSTIRPATKSEWGKKQPFTLAVAARSLDSYAELIGFAHPEKKEKLDKIISSDRNPRAVGSQYYAKVESIELSGIEDVYDVTIEDIHEFDANGIVVHNSNNSVRANVGDDLTKIAPGIMRNGEPGVVWMDVIRNYGRLKDEPDYKDVRVRGLNPCSEQPLENFETCVLAETFINNCTDQDDFIKTLKVAYLYGKTVTLLPTKWERTNTVMQRNRRIGLSASGVADYVDIHGMARLRDALDDGFNYILKLDKKYSEWLCIRDSIRHTTLKPSGSISILAGSSPGVHWTPGGEFFIRRITFSKQDPLFLELKEAGYTHEDLEHDQNSAVILFPIHSKSKRSSSQVPAWEKIHLAAELQHWWSDNAVSCTVDFKPEEAKDIPTLLAMYDGKLKGISFLPAVEGGAYKHMPYEEIDQQMFEVMSAAITKADFSVAYSDGEEAIGEKYCATDYCEVEEEVNLTEGEEIFSVPEIDLASV